MMGKIFFKPMLFGPTANLSKGNRDGPLKHYQGKGFNEGFTKKGEFSIKTHLFEGIRAPFVSFFQQAFFVISQDYLI